MLTLITELEEMLAIPDKHPNPREKIADADYSIYDTLADLRQEVYVELSSNKPDDTLRREFNAAYSKMASISNNLVAGIDHRRLSSIPKFLKSTLDELEDTMQVIATNKEYFNPKNVASIYYQHQQILTHHERMLAIIKKLRRYKTHTILTDCLSDFAHKYPFRENFSMWQVDYYKKILRGLERLIERHKPDEWFQQLWQLLIYYNFNKKRILNYARDTIMAESRSEKPLEERLAMMRQMMYDVKALEENTEWCYDPEHESLKNQLLSILDQEKTYLKEEAEELEELEFKRQGSKITTSATVAQLTLLGEAGLKSGFFLDKEVKHVTRVISRMFRTTRAGKIDYERTARKKIGNYDRSTVTGAIQILHNMEKAINEDYGDLIDNL